MDEALNDTGAPLTVSALTARIRRLVEESFPSLRVVGEVSNLTRARSGHVYLTLKDEGASLSSVIWRSTASRLRHELSEGMEVLASGRLSLYPPRGQYQFDIRGIEPLGAGALQMAFEKLKEKLGAEGLFDEDRKRALPVLPGAIGVVTSPTGAAVRDITRTLARRCPRIPVVIWPARVQGTGAAEEVAEGILRLNERGGLDVLIVGRGGGSLEDLWAFNEEVVARAVAASRVPVISAVGHEVDFTISDFVADVRAATPSTAAELAAPSEAELRAGLDGAGQRLLRAVTGVLANRRGRLSSLAVSYGLRGLPDRLRERAQRLDDQARRLGLSISGRLRACRERLGELAGRCESLSPLQVLARGYSVTVHEANGTVNDASSLSPGDVIRTRYAKGETLSKITEVLDGEDV